MSVEVRKTHGMAFQAHIAILMELFNLYNDTVLYR